MEPEAQLIAAQAAEELARQQATGQVDELQRGRMAQQILQGAGQRAQAREAQQRKAEFARRKRLGDVVAAGEAENRLREYRKKTKDIGGMFQAGLGSASALAAQYGSYLAEQNALAEGLKAAEAKGGIQGAVNFLNENPNYDPGQETLQRLYAGSQMGQQDASIDAVERELLQEQNLADIELRRRNERAVEALNRRADDFIATQALKNLEQDVARDMAAAEIRREKKALDAMNEALLNRAASPEDVEVYQQTDLNPIGVPSMRLSPVDSAFGIGEDNPGFQAALDDSFGARIGGIDPMLAEKIRLKRFNRAINQDLLPGEPTLEDRLRLLQALGL
jgi:hypothetical protein